jgi:hypothetical protein
MSFNAYHIKKKSLFQANFNAYHIKKKSLFQVKSLFQNRLFI